MVVPAGNAWDNDYPTPLECGVDPGECIVTNVILSSQFGQPREDQLPKHVQPALSEWRKIIGLFY